MTMSNLHHSSDSYLINEKLDAIYNVHYFKKMFLDDPYRVLIDFPKNKFRSMMILSDTPKDVTLPTLDEGFQFLVLLSDSTDDEYRRVLLNSPLYKEHEIKYDVKLKILNKVLDKQRHKHPEGFNQDIKYKIVRTYLVKLAFHIQVIRIYKTTLPPNLTPEEENEFYDNVKNSVRVRIERESIKLANRSTP
ncbi:unnamed protein product [Ambrosiozyma monospora]|uniref:Unnamed protein product n=1 Tax=Ambrosiozyma monospora TaxID=43982 RepID=A0ACB5UBM0_AMBMO|nr:unnamed protein product [Ambrosiozyma monospora]